ncbi:MAG: ATP-dependent helicase [Candidatus Pacebacteria bacterium]|nr:ATP-dependent helicase [Candidatus Paceibacterota bacterium]MCF7862944.1 ATP-dependent helicase [Candidatus Paceibacterota bacterium]
MSAKKIKEIQDNFEEEYKKLNKFQKEAVDTIDGPVMVVAGPGTGKTQVLALRIGNILKQTDTPPSSILCLTFTNSGVRAMQKRLHKYIGGDATKVSVSTFHSFAINQLIQKHYHKLDFEKEPKILSDDEAVFLIDEILHDGDWKHISPRANPEMYFEELKHLISTLKREGIAPDKFKEIIEVEIENIKDDPDNISSRGESKGKLKKDSEKKIESLERTLEVVSFYEVYEEKKKALARLDYDDVLSYAVLLVKKYEDVRADIQEEYLYVLVDEHQDSSGVQNDFLKAVWGSEEKPNIFVVGDDRQLIYGFSGASLSYFEEFVQIFKDTKLITLIESYRSAPVILSLAENILKSSIAEGKLKSTIDIKGEIHLSGYAYPRDEVLGAGLFFKQKIDEGVKPEECALLVPRKYQVRNAINLLENMGIKTSSGKEISLFELPETKSFLRILGIIIDPNDFILLSESILDKFSEVPYLEGHKFLKSLAKLEKITLEDIKKGEIEHKNSLFGEGNVSKWGMKLSGIVEEFSHESVVNIVAGVGKRLMIDNVKDHNELLRNVEVVRTFTHLAELFQERSKAPSLTEFITYIKRLESYGNHIPLASFGSNNGVQVMTLHKSKGLEYRFVWVAHMNEEVIMSGKKNAFTLPEKIKEHLKERDEMDAKRELYVAVTRAKEHCTLSYSDNDYRGRELSLANIINELTEVDFVKKNVEDTESELLALGPEIYIPENQKPLRVGLEELKEFVRENYADVKVAVTLLNNFFDCPWKWYFRSFLKLPELKSKSSALGSAVHSTIDFILKNKKVLKGDELEAKLEEYIKKDNIDLSKREIQKLVNDGKEIMQDFLNGFYKNISKEYLTERPLSFHDSRFAHLLMYGRIDLSEELNGSEKKQYIVTDFKTGSVKTKGVIEKIDEEGRLSPHMRQLTMYSYLFEGATSGKVMLSRLLYLEASQNDKNATYETNISNEQIDLLVRDITEYDNLLKTGEWVHRPCNFTPFGKEKECQYCKMAKIYE